MNNSSPPFSFHLNLPFTATAALFTLCGFSSFFWLTPYYSHSISVELPSQQPEDTDSWPALLGGGNHPAPGNSSQSQTLSLIGTFVSADDSMSTALLINSHGELTKVKLGASLSGVGLVSQIGSNSIQITSESGSKTIHLARSGLFPGKVNTASQESKPNNL